MKTLCIYHGNCADGFGAAWVVRKALGEENVEFHAGVHQDPPPDVTGRDVLIVDFSYKLPVLEEMAEKAWSILIIDHHKTAFQELSGKINIQSFLWRDWVARDSTPNIAATFDMNRSGAGLTWDFFFPNKNRPRLIDHIEDRDLWKFKLPKTREIQAAVFSYPYDFKVWDKLMGLFDSYGNSHLAIEGAAIERKHHKDIAELVQVVTRPMLIGGQVVPMANLPYTLTSDAGHLLCGDDLSFAGCYWDTNKGRVFSLRSREGGADVGEIAKQYGGGGHKHAAGFRVPHNELDQFSPELRQTKQA